MTIEPTDSLNVDVNTDDLDAFSDLIHGVKEAKQEDSVEVNKNDSDQEESSNENEDSLQDSNSSESDTNPDGDEGPEKDEKPKKVNRVQERINELTARAREAERALEALKAAQANKQEDTAPKTPTSFVASAEGPDPNALNPDGSEKYPLGEFDPDYIRDMARHTIETEWARKEQEAQEQQQKRQIEEARSQLQEQWVEKLNPVLEEHEDFLEKTMELEGAFEGLDPNYSDYLVQTIKSLDYGPQVLYYFANNLEEAHKFVNMGPLQATLALGEINAMFKGTTRKADPKVSKAPPPPQVNKGTKTRVAVSPDTDDLDDFAKLLFAKKA